MQWQPGRFTSSYAARGPKHSGFPIVRIAAIDADRVGAEILRPADVHQAMPHGFTRFEMPAAARALAQASRWCSERLGHAG